MWERRMKFTITDYNIYYVLQSSYSVAMKKIELHPWIALAWKTVDLYKLILGEDSISRRLIITIVLEITIKTILSVCLISFTPIWQFIGAKRWDVYFLTLNRDALLAEFHWSYRQKHQS